MKTSWVVTYYETGMTPKEKKFDNEADALAWWDDNVEDGRMGLSVLEKVERLRER